MSISGPPGLHLQSSMLKMGTLATRLQESGISVKRFTQDAGFPPSGKDQVPFQAEA